MISIITPTYNRSEHLKLTHAALYKQKFIKYNDFEWIIVDDGSTDDTEQVVKKMTDDNVIKIKYYKFDTHNGYRQNRCRNQGARLADNKSEAYLFLDADVLLYPDAVSKYLEALKFNDKRIIVGMYWWGSPMEITVEDVNKHWEKILNESLPAIENAQPHGMQGKDIRENSFATTTPNEMHFDDGHALACFGGNLLVPKNIFREVARYNMTYNPKDNTDEFCGYDQYYDAPVEDGDFGLNLRDLQIPVSLHNGINGYHVWHPRNIGEIQQKSQENIVYLDKKHNIDVVKETKKVHQREWKI